MSKSLNIIVLILIMNLMGAVGFLGYRVSELNQLYALSQNTKVATAVDAVEVGKKLESFQTDLADQGELLKQFSLNITKVAEEFERFAARKYMPAPQYTISDDAFATKPGETGDTIVADLASYNQWLKQNELFLDLIAKKILPLEYDHASAHVVVKDIARDSVFYQIGLREGDKIATVDNKVINKGDELRDSLLQAKDKQIVVLRDGKKLTLNVQYKQKEGEQVALDITKEQFDEALPELLTSLKIAPVVKDGGMQGIEIVDIGPDNVLSFMNLKSSDVIVKIDGSDVNNKQFLATLKSANDPMQIEYLRGDVPGSVQVNFSK